MDILKPCDKCIHKDACEAQYDSDSEYFDFSLSSCFEDTVPPDCVMFEDKSYYLRPKYRIGDHVWTISVSDNDIPTCIEEFAIYEIRWDGDEFGYYDSEYFLYGERHLFGTKKEAEVALNRYFEV